MQIRASNGLWMTAEQGGGINGHPGRGPARDDALIADRTDADLARLGNAWQQFTLVNNTDGTVSVRCPNGMFWTAEDGGGRYVSTDRTENGAWQRFTLVKVGGDTLFRCVDGVHFLRVRTDLARPVVDATGTMQGLTFRLEGIGSGGGGVEIRKRAPLPPFDRDTTDPDTGAPLPVHTKLTQTIPARGTLRWWRGNAWGVTLPGLPFVEGGARGPAQRRVLTWFLDRWSPEFQDRILVAHLERGYDRFVLSWPDSRDGNRQSIAEYVATARRVKDAGLLPMHMLLSKVFDPRNPDPRALDPVLDALLAADVIPLASVGWELDLFIDPGSVITGAPSRIQPVIDHISGRLGARTALYVHFSPHVASWHRDSPPSGPQHLNGGDFWRPNVGKLTGLLYQTDPTWSVGMMQARINDVLVRLKAGGLWGVPADFDVVAWETIATEQFFNRADEDRGDLVGYETLCAQGPMAVQGFGNGARMPDGNAI